MVIGLNSETNEIILTIVVIAVIIILLTVAWKTIKKAKRIINEFDADTPSKDKVFYYHAYFYGYIVIIYLGQFFLHSFLLLFIDSESFLSSQLRQFTSTFFVLALGAIIAILFFNLYTFLIKKSKKYPLVEVDEMKNNYKKFFLGNLLSFYPYIVYFVIMMIFVSLDAMLVLEIILTLGSLLFGWN